MDGFLAPFAAHMAAIGAWEDVGYCLILFSAYMSIIGSQEGASLLLGSSLCLYGCLWLTGRLPFCSLLSPCGCLLAHGKVWVGFLDSLPAHMVATGYQKVLIGFLVPWSACMSAAGLWESVSWLLDSAPGPHSFFWLPGSHGLASWFTSQPARMLLAHE